MGINVVQCTGRLGNAETFFFLFFVQKGKANGRGAFQAALMSLSQLADDGVARAIRVAKLIPFFDPIPPRDHLDPRTF
jgi:hypothetical protein